MAKKQLGLWILTALVVGNMVGSGIFMLPRSLAEVASPAGVMIGWIVTGLGVLFLALVFGNLAIRKPEIDGGPQLYAKDIFPKGSTAANITGFLVTWGYWVANFAGNVAIITTFASYLSTFFPIMTSEAVLFNVGTLEIKSGNLLTFIVCSVLLWGTHLLIIKGIEGAGKLNVAATAAKVIGFFLFIIVTMFVFDKSNIIPFTAPRVDASGNQIGLLGQVNNAAVTTLWAFVGIESAVVFASRARKKKDVKTATILGLILATVIYIAISFLVMGVLTQDQLIASEKPLVDALATIMGVSGSYILAGLGLISLFGSTIGWVLLSSEVPYQSAKQGLFMKAFVKENKNGTPVFALTITNIMSQLFIFSTISSSVSKAFDFVIYVATLSYLVPYLFVAVYQLKLVITAETYVKQARNRVVDGILAILATVYALWVVKTGTADIKTFLLGIGLIFSGIIFYPIVYKQFRKDQMKSLADEKKSA